MLQKESLSRSLGRARRTLLRQLQQGERLYPTPHDKTRGRVTRQPLTNAPVWLAMKGGVRHKQMAGAGGLLKLASWFFGEAERGSQAGAWLRGGHSRACLEPVGQAAWSQAHS